MSNLQNPGIPIHGSGPVYCLIIIGAPLQLMIEEGISAFMSYTIIHNIQMVTIVILVNASAEWISDHSKAGA